ncbi:hypothetical protein PsorP6_002481 [Peronosclerospora sorghi]|uniref:Uncharacterized protein n=1 Tax=Peronosclerospora sorghi TaxID=230839 RepID=A0ACC0WY31_9STRA|nr:hypothetical protein PsorP6_002481 [Peronosclerospora sorghi]
MNGVITEGGLYGMYADENEVAWYNREVENGFPWENVLDDFNIKAQNFSFVKSILELSLNDVPGAKENNLQNLSITVKLGTFISVTGVSGVGKSSLIINTFYHRVKHNS